MIDLVGQPLTDALEQIHAAGIPYRVELTSPTRSMFVLDDQLRYIIRQQLDAEGILHLSVAAKMGKEVF
ncbi:MAG TPA: hypothetical protein VN611_09420 [Patescibacteria group bacterium]|nr:hypothetical protein [Patescibacteria group bacterium]